MVVRRSWARPSAAAAAGGVLLICALLSSTSTVTPAAAASMEAVEAALRGSTELTTDFSKAVDIVRALMRYKAQPLEISGHITLLLGVNDEVHAHELQHFTAPLKHQILSLHTLCHRYTADDLWRMKNSTLCTKLGKQKIRVTKVDQTVFLGHAQGLGKGRPCSGDCQIVLPDLYVGRDVAVHGISCVLTPFDFMHGPFCRREIEYADDP